MRVVKDDGKTVKCQNCDAILEYHYNDIKEVQTHINEYGKYITCPVCHVDIKVG